MSKPYDQSSRYVAEQDPETILRLLGLIGVQEEAEIEVLPREIGIATKIADLPYRVIINGIVMIALLEMQTVYTNKIPDRILEYLLRLWLVYKVSRMEAYVLLLTKTGLSSFGTESMVVDVSGLRMELNYHLVKVWELDGKEALATGRSSVLPLVPLMRGGREELIAAATQIGLVADRQRREELSLHFTVLAGLRYEHQDIMEILGGIEMIPLEQLRASSTYQYILQEGRQEGLEEGEQKGKIVESRHTLTKLIAKRFPDLNLQAEIESITSLSILEELCLQVLDAANSAEMQQWVMEKIEHK